MKLPARPLLAVLEREAIRQGYPGNQAVGDTPGEGFKSFCKAIGIHAETVHRARDRGWLTLDMADRIAVALGLHPILVWPGEYEWWLGCEPPPDPTERHRDLQRQHQRERLTA